MIKEITLRVNVCGKRNYNVPTNCLLRSELAMELFPSPTCRQAVVKMRYWMRTDPLLRRHLRRAGYRHRTHFLRPAVVRVFREFFG